VINDVGISSLTVEVRALVRPAPKLADLAKSLRVTAEVAAPRGSANEDADHEK